MKTITLNQVVQSQKETIQTRQADTRFIGDYETIEFNSSDYDNMYLVDTDHSSDHRGTDMYETVVAICDNDYWKITAKTTDFNGEAQVSYSRQQLSLNGLNFFMKDSEEDIEGIYNNYLTSLGYDFTLEDVKTLGEYLPEYNCTTLQFKDENDNKHYITVNKLNQLSKVTVKLSDRKVGRTKTSKSAFGF